jgi:hypothetical protein
MLSTEGLVEESRRFTWTTLGDTAVAFAKPLEARSARAKAGIVLIDVINLSLIGTPSLGDRRPLR